jgi:pimeloyl-ACP methyl ester carboxylesterase
MFLNTPNATLHYHTFGPGPRMLLAFGGWAGSWELWAGPFGALSRAWRAVAFDHRGSGATITSLEAITVDNMVADVFAVMDALDIGRCVLAAESAGATVALLAALARPERFDGLVLVDGLIHHPPFNPGAPFVTGLRADFEATIAAFAQACAPGPDNESIRHWGRQILRRSGQAAAIRLIECLAGIDLRPRVAEVSLPTVIIHGSADALVPLADAEWLAAQLPDATLHVLPGAGHVPTLTHPAEVAAIIDAAFGAAMM